MRNLPLALAPNPDRLAAALSLHRAVNAKRHAILFPHTAERENESVRFWKESAAHHRRMAEFNADKPVRTWSVPQFRDEAAFLFGTSRAAVLAGVE